MVGNGYDVYGTIPGSVYSFLLENNSEGDPYFRNNEQKFLELMEHEYEFSNEFNWEETEGKVFLHCDGLDTLCELYLNGKKIAYTDNMHRTSGYNDKATLEGLKAYEEAYEKGVLHPTFYTHKAQDVPGYFYSGKAGILFTSCGASDFQTYKTRFEEANPGLDGDECIDVMWIEGKDGKVRAREMANYWSCLYFNPELDDEVFHRILSMLDYLASEEGEKLFSYGFEGKDYKVEKDGEITSLIPQGEDGTAKSLVDVYPSVSLFANIRNTSVLGPAVKEVNKQKISDFMRAKVDSKPESKKLDLEMEFYSSDIYSKFSATLDVATIMAEIITGNEDVEKAWKSKVKSLQNKIDEVSAELNKTIGKK